ncbi:SH3 domain-containing protein [Aquabacterium sp.]|uniref:SH3 domain-containing protein n=1 Tax=Aquabacterium sp. TaxID=1872578 RepID=UPI001D3AA7C4|nr:SH3 domain-containing protein [Aquabacterium sp.]MBT9610846.1 SH3 domain-containing protein [Aquabacterium sp.]|tara:strand:+ start:1800 stop:2303 length:504 start_codon:yes stop_codon:yes gene_type:complete
MARFAPSALLSALALATFSPLAAAQAYTQSATELRLGPGTDWTLVTELPPSTFVRVIGCDPRYRWCQVRIPHGLQGWLPGDSLRDVRDDQALRRDGQGSLIDFPAIVFTGIQFGQPIVPGAAVQRSNGTRNDITRRQPLPTRAATPASDTSGGSEREPVFPSRGGPR